MASNDNSNKGSFVLILVAMMLGVVIGLLFGGRQGRHYEAIEDKVSEVMSLVKSQYVEDIDEDTLSERLLSAMLSELDPHSSYMSAAAAQRVDEQMRGHFYGVGLILHREGDTSYVGTVMENGPSAHVGLLPGDLILTVDGDTMCGPKMPADSVVAHLRGKKGTTVRVQVMRGGEPIEVSIRRGEVSTPSVAYSGMLDEKTGYIMLSSFTTTSDAEFGAALERMKSEGMKDVIVDLRGNGGGSLQAAIGIANLFLKRGDLIVYTQGAHMPRHNVRAKRTGMMAEGEVRVLIDEFSASASEVLSGALQDNGRATIMGRRSFGKGLVQTEFQLADGSAVLLTTARYYTPSGRCIQRPYSDGSDEYYRAFVERVVKEMEGDSTAYDGGIIPDVEMGYQSDSSIVYYNRLANQGLINSVAFKYVRQHAAELVESYATAADFEKRFKVSNTLVDDLVKAGEKAGIARDADGLRAQRPHIEAMLKANIAMSLFGNEGFYRVYLKEDPQVMQALKYNNKK